MHNIQAGVNFNTKPFGDTQRGPYCLVEALVRGHRITFNMRLRFCQGLLLILMHNTQAGVNFNTKPFGDTQRGPYCHVEALVRGHGHLKGPLKI